VWNSDDELVATLMSKRRRRSGLHTMEWDGTGDHGRTVPDGPYEIEVTSSTIFTTVSNRLSVYKTSGPAPQLWTRRRTEEELDHGIGLEFSDSSFE
jgi:hypothetical protein